MLERMSKRERRLAVITLSMVAGAVVYRAAIFPQVSEIWALRDRAAALSYDLMEKERALALAERIESDYRAYESAIAQKGTDLEESIRFLRTVSDLTRAAEMKIAMQEQPPVELSNYYKLFSVRLGVQSRPIWLAHFLASLEDSTQLIRIEDITVTSLDDRENLAVNMKLTKVVAAGGSQE